MTWILIFITKAVTISIGGSIEDEISDLPESLTGFNVNQIWNYLVIGIIHGLIGGLFLKIDLKKNLEKIKKTAHNNG
jgi:H+/Cl- antiporter ClcA